jgi:proline iminopeptidase
MHAKILAIILLTLTSTAQSVNAQTFHTLKNGDAVISYSVYGSGEEVLLINGGPGYSSDHLRSVAKEIANKYKVILFDQRGTGKSSVKKYDSNSINLSATLSDIDAIRKDLRIERWVVSGQSFGGLLAMAYAANYAQNVERLILISSAGLDLEFLNSFQDNVRNIIGKDTIRYQMPDNTSPEDFFLNIVGVNAPAYVFDKSKVEVIRSILVDKDAYTPEVNAFMWRDLFSMNFDLAPKLKSFKKRTLIVQGAQDIVGMDTAFKTHLTIEGSTLKFIRKCGHVPWLDQPQKFYSILFEFLAEK